MTPIKVVFKDEKAKNKSFDEKLLRLLEFTINTALLVLIPFMIGFYLCATKSLWVVIPLPFLMLLTPEIDIDKEKIQFRIKRVL